jgi:hypothetical protein
MNTYPGAATRRRREHGFLTRFGIAGFPAKKLVGFSDEEIASIASDAKETIEDASI